jgi:hypothetical protein
VSGVGHHADVGVSDASLVHVDDGWVDDGVLCTMRDQRRLADRRQEIVIVDRA